MSLRGKNSRGFTLIEVMIAIFIFSLIATMVFGGYHTVLSNAEYVRREMKTAEAGARAVGRITDDLSGLFVLLRPEFRAPEDREEEGEDPWRMVGEVSALGMDSYSSLRFTSTSHLAFEGKTDRGIAEIRYYVDRDDMDRRVLRRADRLFFHESFEPSSRDPILCMDVSAFRLGYFDASGERYETWHSDDSATGMSTPAAVEILLTIGEEASARSFETRVRLPVVRIPKE